MKVSKKIILLGHFGVGKSSLIRQFVENSFTTDYKVTIGVHILKKEVQIAPNETISLIIWDLEGYDDIKKTRASYLLGTHGFIYVFDVTRPATFQNLEDDITYLTNQYANTPLKVVGNKADLVTKSYLKENKAIFGVTPDFFTSAKTGDNVADLFTTLAKELVK
ncbi:GTP-binding protein [Kordia sp. YSTF-M3]|uniref:GTP-binding protein n=1 Tax=Kordia aestuariivivens TaxID=2759037 RepID=A0ABR7QAN3_9FLAO|nr:Rab family GTPase [Kordia aestuariivivens]MBC8755639.1 GTP-binding protein [Kordia aestuariivivens]